MNKGENTSWSHSTETNAAALLLSPRPPTILLRFRYQKWRQGATRANPRKVNVALLL